MRALITLRRCWLAFLILPFVESSFSYADCPLLAKLSRRIAIDAYQTNISKTLSRVAKKHKIPIVFRETTPAAEALQQQGFPTRPMRIKNKSSPLPGIEGFIPCDGKAGKYGERLRVLLQAPGSEQVTEEGNCKICELEEKIATENILMNSLLAETYSDGRPRFTKLPITRLTNGVREVVTYYNEKADRTRWVPFTDPPPARIAWVLGDSERRPFTADTDLVLVGQPKTPDGKHEIIFDDEFGFRTSFSDQLRIEINQLWQFYSENANTVVDHGEEANFGLNPIDEVYFAFSHLGKLTRFDLRKINSSRSTELTRYAFWLKGESKYADIIIPDESLQKAREKYLESTYGMHLDYHSVTQDYDQIKKVLGPLAKSVTLDN